MSAVCSIKTTFRNFLNVSFMILFNLPTPDMSMNKHILERYLKCYLLREVCLFTCTVLSPFLSPISVPILPKICGTRKVASRVNKADE